MFSKHLESTSQKVTRYQQLLLRRLSAAGAPTLISYSLSPNWLPYLRYQKLAKEGESLPEHKPIQCPAAPPGCL